MMYGIKQTAQNYSTRADVQCVRLVLLHQEEDVQNRSESRRRLGDLTSQRGFSFCALTLCSIPTRGIAWYKGVRTEKYLLLFVCSDPMDIFFEIVISEYQKTTLL